MRFLASELEAMDAGTNFLSQYLDLTNIGAIGHSLGGNAALEFYRIDSRCRAAINLDGANWNEVGRVGLKGKPAIILAAEHPEYTMPCTTLVNFGAFPDVERCEAERAVLWEGWRIIRDTADPFHGITINGSKHVNLPVCRLCNYLTTRRSRRSWDR